LSASPDLQALVGTRFPDGEFTITPEEHERLRGAVDGIVPSGGTALPVWAHIATHVGKGVTFSEFAELIGSSFDAGFLFGGGAWDFVEPVRIGKRYLVRGGITGASSRVGRRTGPFDVVTTEIDLVDPDTGERVCTSIENYICPRGT
jgi:hypothetical protein